MSAGEFVAWVCVIAAMSFTFWIADDIREALNDPCDDRPEGDCPAVPPAFHSATNSGKGQRDHGA